VGARRPEPRLGSEKAEELATIFRRGEWTYDHPLEVEALRRLGLPINTDMPHEVEGYMRLFPQPQTGRASVQCIPLPYRSPGRRARAPLPRTRGGPVTPP